MKRIVSLFLLLSQTYLFAQGKLPIGDTLKYDILFNGRKAGYSWLCQTGPRQYASYQEYNDRGRGPKLLTTFKISSQGIVTSLHVEGNNYMKGKVAETYELLNSVARWENTAEKQQVSVTKPAIYLSTEADAPYLAWALLASPEKKIDLLPAGQSSIRLLKEHILKNKKKAYLYSITGLGFDPSLFWLDENQMSLGSFSDSFTEVREDVRDDAGDLYQIQKEEMDGYYSKLTSQLVSKSRTEIAFHNVNVFDSERGKVLPARTVLIIDGKIQDVGDASLKVPKGYTIIEGKGKTLLPGLWDMHTHYGGGSEGLLNIACGVTNIRDMGNSLSLLELQQQIDNGEVIGPRIVYRSGIIDGDGPYTVPLGISVSNLEEGIRAIRKYDSLGYQQIKLYSSIKPEWVKPMADEAHRLGLRVAGHIPSHMTATQAINAGYNEITHANMLFLNFYGDTVDTRSMRRFTLVGEKAASLDFESKEFKDFVKLFQDKHISIDPTLGVFEGMFTSSPSKPSLGYSKIMSRLPATMQRNASWGALTPPPGQEETYRNAMKAMQKLVKKFYDAGILIVSGTDDLAGFILHRELELYAEAGIPTTEVLKTATYNAAKLSNKLDVLGTITKGKIADVILVDGDPIRNISDIRRVSLVVKDGNLYDPKKLLKAISVKYFE
ncbi:amidohydrolase family protein [Xanthocytophaga flava]|uniref:amidohydrolase family protein n=1 Tax=Xanthocytophaga flava TaxID=3048013 RepID=UPI0028D1A0C6|nr:amidohydrolase family protein [Xanthocytophaga flavus]MDJ1466777.1 amidohydrolase family protein [Xanthocytophaga flavus]